MATTRRKLLFGLAGVTALSASTCVVGTGIVIYDRVLRPQPPIEFSGGVKWMTWEAAAADAASTGRTRMLFLYADWCGVCRNLAPVFERADVQQAASELRMVRQNQDAMPPWLTPYLATGGYVPRVLFLDSTGQVRSEITSGRSDYPFFYETAEDLLPSMQRAALT